MKKNGIKQIAEKAGCSCATVSRVLNGRPGISEDVRKKIFEIATEVDYANSRKKRIIALLVYLDNDGFDDYSMHLLRLMVQKLRRAGFYVEVLFDENYEILEERYVSGIISINIYGNIAERLGYKIKLPMVCVNDFDNLPEDIHAVYSDDRQAITEAVDYLVSCGHKSIYLMGVKTKNNMNNSRRIQAFMQYTDQLGMQDSCGVIFCRGRFVSSISCEKYVKQLPADCTAVISTIESVGAALYRTLQKTRPDVTLLSWQYTWDKAFDNIKIPSMQQNFRKLVDYSVEMLINQLDGKRVYNQAVPYIFKKYRKKI